VSAVSIEILLELFVRFCRSDFASTLFGVLDIARPHWWWLPGIGLGGDIVAFGLATAAIVGTLSWKPGSRMLQRFVIFLSVVVLIWASLSLFALYVITHLNP
jgi:hypothetical protein